MHKLARWSRNLIAASTGAATLVVCTVVVALSSTVYAGISEPETVLYGKIVNRTWVQPFLVTTGSVTCVISVPNSGPIVVTTPLQPLNDGAFSYQMRIPHEALSQGLFAATNVVPLLADPSRLTFLQFTVNGGPASVLASTSAQILLAQANRAATYRLDLEVFNTLADSDGDGIPDWWEQKYGFDPFYAADAALDSDRDGWTNLKEFLNGTDPTKDDRSPSVTQTDFSVYADGSTALLPKPTDTDSVATQLTYTLQGLPAFGNLVFRNAIQGATNNDAVLTVGSHFTQDDVDHCRIVYVHTSGSAANFTTTSISIADENTNHVPSVATLKLTILRPSDATLVAQLESALTNSSLSAVNSTIATDQQTTYNDLLSRDLGYVVADASSGSIGRTIQAPSGGLSAVQYETSYTPAYGKDRKHLFIGTADSDRFVGGMENDIFVSNRGSDIMRGNGGADIFVFNIACTSSNVIEDFSITDTDVLDVSRLFDSVPGALTNYVRATTNTAGTTLGINFDGNGVKYTNMTITLLGVQTSLADLGSSGLLLTGAKVLTPRVTIVATQSAASQNGPVSGVFTVTRTGSLAAALTANIAISGSAVNGSGYQLIGSTVTIPAGSATATIVINPYVTATTYTSVVQIAISPGTGYDVIATNSAQITIEPLPAQITVEALGSVAEKSSLSPGVFLITRGGVVDRSLLVRLKISGSAGSNLDYVALPTFVNLAAQQTTALLYVTPRSTASVANAKDVVVSIQADSSYKVMTPSSARVLIVDQLMDLAAWQQKYFPTSSVDQLTFALTDTGSKGIRNLYRYAFGLDPINPQLSTNAPAGKVRNDYLSLSFRKPASVTDIDYVVEVSTDLLNWRSSIQDVEPDPNGANTVEQVTYRSTRPLNQVPMQYMRVRLQFKN